ncbi:hypothetical protein EDD16DRAFT_1619169 [Pisolithus croceorrhizus]|nr:hypothetical protein EDD16DRAFT_1619169 [Pisolithus croceorrhizus]
MMNPMLWHKLLGRDRYSCNINDRRRQEMGFLYHHLFACHYRPLKRFHRELTHQFFLLFLCGMLGLAFFFALVDSLIVVIIVEVLCMLFYLCRHLVEA